MHQKPDFLTDYEFKVLQLTNEGRNPQEIADYLNSDAKFHGKGKKKPSGIRKARVVVRQKIEKELQKIANSLRLDTNLRTIPKGSGILIGYDWVHDTYVYLILTGGMVKVWYEHDCSDKCRPSCKETLDLIKKEREIQLENNQESLPVLKQFRLVISKIQEKEWLFQKYKRKKGENKK